MKAPRLTQDERDLIAVVFRGIDTSHGFGYINRLAFFDDWMPEDFARVKSVLNKLEDPEALEKPFQTDTAKRLWG